MKRAYYSAKIKDFLVTPDTTVLGELTAQHQLELNTAQRNAWQEQISILKSQLLGLSGHILFEFSIPRMGRRTDVILFVDGVLFVLEFKVGDKEYGQYGLDQVTDYALDLKNFHEGSHSLSIVPILVSTKAQNEQNQLIMDKDHLYTPVKCNASNIASTIAEVLEGAPKSRVDFNTWLDSGYKPTPTIVEAAQALYQGHQVEEISRSDAGAKNLSHTADFISTVIEESKQKRQKSICFVTGVPGAGKTLAGLNIATERTKTYEEEHAVFLSGNGPLVEVLREALARDEVERNKGTDQALSKSAAAKKVKSFVQNIHHFRDEYLRTTDAPVERVVVFDEAQRAWNQSHAEKFMVQKRGQASFDMSEPEFLISVMDRHQEWCTVICLIGGGQEINSGEAGLVEWFSALRKRFGDWHIYAPPQIEHKDYTWGHSFTEMLSDLNYTSAEALHLAVSVRSFRAEKLSAFISAVIDGNLVEAQAEYQQIKDNYPIVITRDLAKAKQWAKGKARGSERYGMLASSGANRLKPEGVNVKNKIDAPTWFLNDKLDVRSSCYLEDVATEFDVQGLELDWTCVCWDADFRYEDGGWGLYQFKGSKWQNVNDEFKRVYLKNAYRVLLTRARQGMVIYVPLGSDDDWTRPRAYYDGVFSFLRQCGLKDF